MPQPAGSRLLFAARIAPVAADVVQEPVSEPAAVVTDVEDVTVPPARSGPTTRVHAERLVAVSGKLRLTPSQAVRMASDGRDVLTRGRPRAR